VLSIEGRVRAELDRRVSAHEHQLETSIRDRVDVEVINLHRCVLLGVEGYGPLSRRGRPAVAEPVAGDCEQPRVRVAWHPAGGPRPQGTLEGVGEGIFRGGEVARRGSEERQQPAVAVPCGQAGGVSRRPRRFQVGAGYPASIL
jgi:hypothetical protein